jgi:hypothetical protein
MMQGEVHGAGDGTIDRMIGGICRTVTENTSMKVVGAPGHVMLGAKRVV